MSSDEQGRVIAGNFPQQLERCDEAPTVQDTVVLDLLPRLAAKVGTPLDGCNWVVRACRTTEREATKADTAQLWAKVLRNEPCEPKASTSGAPSW